MTAPDPGLTDLIAAHQFDPVGRICSCGVMCGVVCDNLTYPSHVASVVEQHTNGRMASDLGADPQDYEIAWAAKLRWQARAEKAEAAIARVEAEAALLERMIRTAPWSRYTEVRRSHLRSLCAALERPGDTG